MADRIDRIRGEKEEHIRLQAMEQEKRRLIYSQCFATEAGKKVLLDILTRSYLFSTTFTGNSQSYFNEGARAFALELIGIIPGLAGSVISDHCNVLEYDLAMAYGERG